MARCGPCCRDKPARPPSAPSFPRVPRDVCKRRNGIARRTARSGPTCRRGNRRGGGRPASVFACSRRPPRRSDPPRAGIPAAAARHGQRASRIKPRAERRATGAASRDSRRRHGRHDAALRDVRRYRTCAIVPRRPSPVLSVPGHNSARPVQDARPPRRARPTTRRGRHGLLCSRADRPGHPSRARWPHAP